MTAKETLQALVDRSIEDMKYSPIDLIKAIALLDQMEQRDLQHARDLELAQKSGSLLQALENSVQLLCAEEEEGFTPLE